MTKYKIIQNSHRRRLKGFFLTNAANSIKGEKFSNEAFQV